MWRVRVVLGYGRKGGLGDGDCEFAPVDGGVAVGRGVSPSTDTEESQVPPGLTAVHLVRTYTAATYPMRHNDPKAMMKPMLRA